MRVERMRLKTIGRLKTKKKLRMNNIEIYGHRKQFLQAAYSELPFGQCPPYRNAEQFYRNWVLHLRNKASIGVFIMLKLCTRKKKKKQSFDKNRTYKKNTMTWHSPWKNLYKANFCIKSYSIFLAGQLEWFFQVVLISKWKQKKDQKVHMLNENINIESQFFEKIHFKVLGKLLD